MVRLTRIYTKTGDTGYSSLADGTRVEKTNLIFDGLGSIDELNAVLGIAINYVKDDSIRTDLRRIQNDLFDLGAALATPGSKFNAELIDYMETRIDYYTELQGSLKSFILPGGTIAASQLHFARTVARRAERAVWLVVDPEDVIAAKYLNRLSDLFFVYARQENECNDVLWEKRL